jgi:endonuclease/exonuclease/phosphatase (EEP) superfamily protein YafD
LIRKALRQWLRPLILLAAGSYAIGLYILLGLRWFFSDSLWWVAFASNFTLLWFLPLLVAFPLALFLRGRRLAALMLPLCLGGMLWYGRYLTAKSPLPAESALLRLTTFNMWVWNPRLDQVALWLREQTPDLVLLQEVPPVWVDGISDLGDLYPYILTQSMMDDDGAKLVLSRLPILHWTNFTLTSEDIFRQQRLVLEVEGQQIAVYHVHLFPLKGDYPRFRLPFAPHSLFVNTILAYDERIRRQQIDALLMRLTHERLPFVVAGDFNLSDQSRLYDRLAAQWTDSYLQAGSGLGWTWPAAVAELPVRLPLLARLDYVWHGAGLRAVAAQVGPALYSDHLPLSVTLTWENPTGA